MPNNEGDRPYLLVVARNDFVRRNRERSVDDKEVLTPIPTKRVGRQRIAKPCLSGVLDQLESSLFQVTELLRDGAGTEIVDYELARRLIDAHLAQVKRLQISIGLGSADISQGKDG